jgi:hypothetical protein
MSFFSKANVTNIFLGTIALLLLILVIENATKSNRAVAPEAARADGSQDAFRTGELPPGHPPIDDSMPGGGPVRRGNMPPDAGRAPADGQMGGGGPPAGGPMGSGGDFDPSQMVYTAMVCPDDASLALDAASCTGKKAEERKAMVKKEFEKNKGIKEVFDDIVKKYGEAALSAQAQAIHKSRKAM